MKDQIFQMNDTQSFVRSVLESKQNRSKGFSLRQFAKKLGVSAASVSNFITGKRSVSPEFILNVCDQIQLSAQETEHLLALHLIKSKSSHTSARLKTQIQARINSTRKKYFTTDEADSLYHWRSGLLLEATRVPDLIEDRSRLSKALKVSTQAIDELLGDLVTAGILKHEGARFIKTSANFQLATETPGKAAKRYHLDWLKVAEERIREGRPEDRHLGGETIAISEDKVEDARRVINRCLDDLAAIAAQSPSPTQVYHCNIQFFEAVPKLRERK